MVKRGKSLASSVRISQEDSAPVLISENDSYAKIVESRGKGQFLVSLPCVTDLAENVNTTLDSSVTTVSVASNSSMLVYMPPKFRNALWIRRGSFVIIRKYDQNHAELLHILTGSQVKEIRKAGGWPKDFTNEVVSEEQEEEISLIESEVESEDIEISESESEPEISKSQAQCEVE